MKDGSQAGVLPQPVLHIGDDPLARTRGAYAFNLHLPDSELIFQARRDDLPDWGPGQPAVFLKIDGDGIVPSRFSDAARPFGRRQTRLIDFHEHAAPPVRIVR
jgi:hypothetical protein